MGAGVGIKRSRVCPVLAWISEVEEEGRIDGVWGTRPKAWPRTKRC